MALKTYKTSINGIDHTVLLDDEDAVRRGLDPAKDSVSEDETATSPLVFDEPTTDGGDVESNVAADTKSRTVANKSRAADSK